jgi:hypothetical protein
MTSAHRVAGVVLALVTWSPSSADAAGAAGIPAVQVLPHEQDRRVEVRVDGRLFTAYVWPERLAKPVLFPIRSAAGNAVTRAFPLEPKPGERADHPHQVGLWFNHGDVNGVDFWNNSEARPPEQRAKMGSIRHVRVESQRSGDGEGALGVVLAWVMPDGSTALDERALYLFSAAPGRRSVDRTTTLTATSGKVTFTDNKEGLLALRVARALEEPSGRPEILADASGRPGAAPVLDEAGVSGAFTSSEGLMGAAVWGTRARWVALAGRLGSEDVVLLLLDHPKNPGHPAHWHARGYGLFAANPLGASVFSGGRERLDLALPAGGTVVFRHRLLVLSQRFSADVAEAEWRQFAAAAPAAR